MGNREFVEFSRLPSPLGGDFHRSGPCSLLAYDPDQRSQRHRRMADPGHRNRRVRSRPGSRHRRFLGALKFAYIHPVATSKADFLSGVEAVRFNVVSVCADSTW